MKLRFSKYSGCGNDFVLIDNRSSALITFSPQTISTLCNRHKGIGADGIIFLEPSLHADFKMRIFNADGSEAEMCGNGLRCLAKFIEQQGHSSKTISIETMHQIINVTIETDGVRVSMPTPTNFVKEISILCAGHPYQGHHLDTGVPHFVIFTDDIQNDQWLAHAPAIRHHTRFYPQGANVNLAKINGNTISLRTYERGVEAETQACGTGAVATALLAASVYGLESPISVQTRSGDLLNISFCKSPDGSFQDIQMVGSANKIFDGEIELCKKSIELK